MNEERAGLIVKDVLESLRDVIRRHGVTYPEYRRAVQFLVATADGGELPLFCDVLLEAVVDETAARSAAPGTTDSNVEGPFFVAGAPDLDRPAGDGGPVALPMRPDETGDPLVFSGTVHSTDGRPVAGAVLDLWQADAAGLYSAFAPGLPEWNLRGRIRTDAAGAFAVRTVVPAPYDIPSVPHLARVLGLLGLEPHRPAHIHVRLEADGFTPLTTQVYFDGDPWLDRDVVGAARRSLATKLEPAAGGDGFAGRFDFVLSPA
ncbi:MAG TPA: dioxygenase [Acidimicrobiia bacterium]|nr:dioxygenase [Acidimicrobiia bacterium]